MGLWVVLARFCRPPTIEGIRKNLQRTEDTKRAARNLSEVVSQHGSRGWLEFMTSKMGPTLMLAFEDMADLLEKLEKYIKPSSLLCLEAVAANILSKSIVQGHKELTFPPNSFYEWRDPWQTAMTLVSFALMFLGVTLIPTWLLIKGSQLFAGIVFFGLFPISSHFPRYRLLVSPTTWIFGRIPTHGEGPCEIMFLLTFND